MASLVAEVLKKSGRFAKDDVHTALEKLSRKIEEVKGEVNGIVQKQYKEYVAVYADTTELLGRVKGLTGEMKQLSDRMENELLHQVREATSEQRELSTQLEKCEAILELLKLLCKISDDLQAIDADVQCGQCVQAAKRLAQTESSLLASLESGCDLPIFEAIRNECAAQRGSLENQLEDSWRRCVSFSNLDSRPVQLVKRDVTVPKTEFKFLASTEGLSSLPVSQIVEGLQALGSMDRHLKLFGINLWQHILLPIIENPNIQPMVKVKKVTTLVHFKPVKGETIVTQIPADLFKKLLTVLKVVHNLLVDPATQSSNLGLTRRLGDQLWDDLSHSIVTHCLSNSIPKHSSELESYQEVIGCVADFESQLIELGYVPNGTDSLTQYAKDVNVHFANQKCQDLLVKARKILLSDMHNTLLIEDEKERGGLLLLDKPPNVDEEVVREKVAGFDEGTLKKATFHFPSCQVSRNVKDLVDLAYDTLIEATESNQCGVQLFFAVRDMFELFRAIVPSYHKKILDELPQMAAIHHNNCMYLAHHLSTLGHQFTNRLPWPINGGTATFVDMVSPLRKCGQDCFIAQLRKRRTALLESLATAENFVGASNPTQSQSIERALKQVMQQLQCLNRVWQDILPNDVFLKSIGALLNSVLDEIIISVLKLQDMSTTEADYIHQLLSVTLDEAPLVFKPVSEKQGLAKVFTVSRYVKHWPKFEKLLVVLEASMQTIVDMWGDGKTSFARLFTVSEVRGLIKALFKNTDRRAEALARIKLPTM